MEMAVSRVQYFDLKKQIQNRTGPSRLFVSKNITHKTSQVPIYPTEAI